MSRLGQVYVAAVFALSGAFAGAAITFHWFSNNVERMAGVQ